MRRIGVVASLLLASCWMYVSVPPVDPVKPGRLRPDASLTVDESGFPWGSGQLGPLLARDLVERQVFERIDYPILPTVKPELSIRVRARGLPDQFATYNSAMGFLQYPSFLGLIPFFEDWQLAADVQIELGDRGILQVPVQGKVRVTHALLASPVSVAPRVREVFVRRIREEIVRALESVP